MQVAYPRACQGRGVALVLSDQVESRRCKVLNSLVSAQDRCIAMKRMSGVLGNRGNDYPVYLFQHPTIPCADQALGDPGCHHGSCAARYRFVVGASNWLDEF